MFNCHVLTFISHPYGGLLYVTVSNRNGVKTLHFDSFIQFNKESTEQEIKSAYVGFQISSVKSALMDVIGQARYSKTVLKEN